MSKAVKIWLGIAAGLTVLGILIFVGALAAAHWDFSNFSNVKFITETYEVEDSFKNISIDIHTSDIAFVLSEDGECRVDSYDTEGVKYSVSVREDTLTITPSEDTPLTEPITLFSFKSPKITVYLTEREYKQLSVSTSTGDVTIPAEFSFESAEITGATSDVDFCASVDEQLTIAATTGDVSLRSLSAGDIELSVTTGDIDLEDVMALGDISVKTTTGDISLKNTGAVEALSLEGVTCDVDFDGCDAGQITVKTTTGDISGTLCSDKIFTAKSSVGDVKVPDTTEGGKCEITTNTGDIHIKIVKSDLFKSTPDSAEKDD